MANAELNVILSADGKSLSAAMNKAESDVQSFSSELKKTVPAIDAVDQNLSKSAASLKKASQAASGASKSISKIIPATAGTSDALQNLQNNLASLDFSEKFSKIQNDIAASVDKMADNATRGSEAVEQLGNEAREAAPKISVLQAAYSKLDSGLNKNTKQFNTSGAAVRKSKTNFTDLSRVIQDLPFGFTAISNNLTQLIPAAGALGLAFSGVIAALTFAQIGFSAWSRGSKDTVDQAKEATAETQKLAEEQQHFAEAVDSAAAAVIGDAKNIKELRDILISTSSATVQLTQATINRGLAHFIFDEKNVELQKILNAQIQKEITLRKQQKPFFDITEFRKGTSAVKEFNRTFNDFGIQLPGGLKAARDADTLNNSIVEAQDSIKGLNALGEGLSGFFKQFLSDGKKGTDLLDDLLRQVRQFETLINERGLRKANFEIIPNEGRDETIKRAQEFIRNAISRRFEFEVNPKLIVEAPEVVRGQKYFSNLSKESEKLIKDMEAEIAKLTKRNPIVLQFENFNMTNQKRGAELADSLGLKIEGVNAQTSLLTDTQKAAVNTANTINGLLTPAFQSLFDEIRRGENPMKAFFKSLGQSVEQLIQKLIQAAIQAAIIQTFFPGLAGGGAQGFGQILKGLLGFRAEGGPVFANRPYIVGEQGPELFIPKGGGQIIPNNHLNSGLAGVSGGMQTVRVVGEISGRDIRLVSARQGRYNGRNA